jgi:hypothetical protein
MTDDELAALQRQAEARARDQWDPTELTLMDHREEIVNSALETLQAEATERAARNWDPDEWRTFNEYDGSTTFQDAFIVAVENAADSFLGERLTPIIPGPYAEYLRSERWHLVRQWMLRRAGGFCGRCHRRFADRALDVHHRDYRRLGAEREADLIVLCRECHATEHGGWHA